VRIVAAARGDICLLRAQTHSPYREQLNELLMLRVHKTQNKELFVNTDVSTVLSIFCL
jgi:hypothetical protein